MVKQHVYDHTIVDELNIPAIFDLMEFQEIKNYLKVSTDYNEDLIQVFYVGLQSMDGHFSF